jgi:hypothetical protein
MKRTKTREMDRLRVPTCGSWGPQFFPGQVRARAECARWPLLAAMMVCGVRAAGPPRSDPALGRVAAQAGSGRGPLADSRAAVKRAEGAFDAASDRFGAAEAALDAAREERAQARRDRYAARQEHERAAAAADRLQRRVAELAAQLDRMAELTGARPAGWHCPGAGSPPDRRRSGLARARRRRPHPPGSRNPSPGHPAR